MAQGDKVTKYGEHIGEANQEIKVVNMYIFIMLEVLERIWINKL